MHYFTTRNAEARQLSCSTRRSPVPSPRLGCTATATRSAILLSPAAPCSYSGLVSRHPSLSRRKESQMAAPEPSRRLRLHRSGHLRRAIAGRGARRVAPRSAAVVERAACRRRRLRRRRILGGQQAPRRARGVAAQRRVLVGQEVDRAAIQGERRSAARSRRARCR